MVRSIEQIFLCQFCQYHSDTKLFQCPECGRNKFVVKNFDLYFCSQCEHSSLEFFRKCPNCSKLKKSADQIQISKPAILKSNFPKSKPAREKPLILPRTTNDQNICICRYCKYQTPTKLFECPECGRTNFIFYQNNLFHCEKCNFKSGEFFKKCPDCQKEKKSKKKSKPTKYVSNQPENNTHIRPNRYKSSPPLTTDKICDDCGKGNEESANRCWSCGHPHFINFQDFAKIRTEALSDIKKEIAGFLILIATLTGIGYFIGPTKLLAILPASIVYLTIPSIVVFASIVIYESYYRFAFAEVNPILSALKKFFTYILIGVMLLVELFYGVD